MYVYNIKNLSETAMKAVMRNLLKDYSEEDARKLMIEKYPHLEGEIVNIDMSEEPAPYTVKSPTHASFESVDDTFDEEAEIDVKGLEDTDIEEDETDRLIKAVESAIEQAEKPVKTTRTKTTKTAVVKETKAAKTTKTAKATTEKGESKAARAREMYNAAADKSRKAVIEMFVTELGMSTSMASTYYYNCCKK